MDRQNFISFLNKIIMKIYLTRHAETIEGEKWIILWQLWWNLSKKWEKEAIEIWLFLLNSNIIIKKIFSSPLKRAVDTANIINTFLKINLEKKDILKERSAGIAEWKSENEIDWNNYEKLEKKYRKHKWWESFFEVRERANKFLKSLKWKKENILVISHNVFICMIISIISNISIKKALNISLRKKIICIDLDKSKIKENIY